MDTLLLPKAVQTHGKHAGLYTWLEQSYTQVVQTDTLAHG